MTQTEWDRFIKHNRGWLERSEIHVLQRLDDEGEDYVDEDVQRGDR